LRFADDPPRIVALDPVYIRAYIPMRFEWDPKKAETNRRKHWVRFSEAVEVFDDDRVVLLVDETSEEKFLAIGMDGFGRVLVVEFTWRGDTIRITSARKATRSEERQYAER